MKRYKKACHDELDIIILMGEVGMAVQTRVHSMGTRIINKPTSPINFFHNSSFILVAS